MLIWFRLYGIVVMETRSTGNPTLVFIETSGRLSTNSPGENYLNSLEWERKTKKREKILKYHICNKVS